MRQLVDERDLGPTREDRVEVELLERRVAVLEGAAWHDLEVADLFRGLLASVGLDEADDDVGAAVAPPPTLVEHRVRLADSGGGPEVDAKRPAGHLVREPDSALRGKREIELEDVDSLVRP